MLLFTGAVEDVQILGGPLASDKTSWNTDTLLYHDVETGGQGYGFFQVKQDILPLIILNLL